MRTIAGREFARMIERRGWQLLRISGSHHIYGKPGSVVRVEQTASGPHEPSDMRGLWPERPDIASTDALRFNGLKPAEARHA